MSNKKSKSKTPEQPTIYQGLVKSNELAKLSIAIDNNGECFKYDTANPLVQTATQHNFPNWADSFDKLPKEDILEWHKKLFNAEPPKDQDLIDTSLWCYMKLVSIAKDRTADAGEKLKNKDKKLPNRIYTIADTADPSKIVTPQMKTCFIILSDTVDPKTKSVDEATLRKAIDSRAAEIKTRQDPWRIFQYYRPTLVKFGHIKHT